MIQDNIERVSVYGVLHSPWVQAVLMGLHEKTFHTRYNHTFAIVINKLRLDDARCKDQQGVVEPGFREDP